MDEIPPPLTDALRDRYEIERELGRGGMAVVYLARDLRHRRPVALKVLHPDLAHALGPERFLREIELAAGLQHPHILPLFDSGEAAGQLWYTMPYVEGESLRDRLRREKQLPLEDALQIARNVLAALAYAHSHGILHRDIKPENILLETGEAVVADFGIARAISAAGGESLTQTGMAVGTPVYMSPEQATGERELDGRSDLYAAGCVLYEMLAGHPPFMGTTPQEILRRHAVDPIPPLRSARGMVPEAVELAITRALAKVPADRWASAQQFAEAFVSARTAPQRRLLRLGLGALGLTALAAGTVLILGPRTGPPAGEAVPATRGVTRLAVLPFENLGDSADAYFAAGVADAVRGKLTTVGGLEVIARTSSMAYHGTDKSPQEVARELGVRYLVTGTVRWAKPKDGPSRVQVSPELVEVRDAGAPASKWQQPFDAALTYVFQVQAEIAGRVAQALDVALGTREQEQLARQPTADLTAYDAFLKGEAAGQALAAQDRQSLRRAAAFYEEAVAQDNTFALAWARLAQAFAQIYGLASLWPADAQSSRRALANAERLAPDAPETYRAQARYEDLVRSDFAASLAAAEAALTQIPDDPELTAIAAMAEFRLGRVEAAVGRLTRARALDPRSFIVSQYLGYALTCQRRWREARRVLNDASSLAPADVALPSYRAMTYLGEGDLVGARRVLADVPRGADRMEYLANVFYYWLLDDSAQQEVLSLPPRRWQGSMPIQRGSPTTRSFGQAPIWSGCT